MKVLVIPTWYPTGKDKLMGNYHKEFTEALNAYGIKADMLFIERERLSKPFKYLFSKKKSIDKENNYEVYKYKMLNLGPLNFNLQQHFYVRKLEKLYKEYIKSQGIPDIIHAQVTVPAGYAACKIGKKYHAPVIVTEHCARLERFFDESPFKEYGNFVLDNAIFSVVSNYMKKYVLTKNKECYVIPNLVDTETFANNKKRVVNKNFNLVSVCALREGKRIDNIFGAMNVLINQGIKNIHLDVIGDGFLEEYYKEECSKLNLSKYVSFLGRKTKQEISKILEHENALVISSDIESFAIPGIEALASGIPVISTKCLGPEEYIDEKCGVLCKVNDVEDLAKAIKKVIENYDNYDPLYLNSVADKFSSKQVIKNTEKIYKKVIRDYNS